MGSKNPAMEKIPLYLKTDPKMPRPQDQEYYLLAQDGLYFCRNHPFFKSDVPTERLPRWLEEHKSKCEFRFPKLGQAALEFIVGFFDRIYEWYGSEAIVFLLWNPQKKRHRLLVPEQEATVWQSVAGPRSAQDVRYELPKLIPPGYILVGDIHSHADHTAHSSWTDQKDERHRDGLHGVVGRIDQEPPDFHLELVVDGQRFRVDFDLFFEGYEKRRRIVPRAWTDKVKVKVEGPWWTSSPR